ncbi:hypothetical protein [Caldanaerobacter subterraneus]|uniref:Uncharacterized protein n=1 Tax=Caldanaerobacter subterraneus TaxID=911092 RepID=A0A7Y2PM50_9THEO|nr:hypothetical protein [Caldanaerobacter subterraneus]NNG67330.1 hypothetical protein [Caldanaerobacter subterraneus]
MSPEVMGYCSRAIIRYLNGDIALFMEYINKAMELYEEEKKKERLYITIGELIDFATKEKLLSLIAKGG